MANKYSKSNIEIDKAFRFIEDICWLIDAQKDIKFSEIPKMIEAQQELNNKKITVNKEKNVVDELIGVLPSLLVDASLFKTNKDLYLFSAEVLGIHIKNWEKKSKYDIIGNILCQIQESDKINDGILVNLLSSIMKNKDKIKLLQEQKTNNFQFSWNEAIQKIVELTNE